MTKWELVGAVCTAALCTGQAWAQAAPTPSSNGTGQTAPMEQTPPDGTITGGTVPATDDQTPPSAEPGLGDIVVTARKASENLQKAPASIILVEGTELVSRGITDPQALEKVLPGANLRAQGPITQTFFRGIGTRSDTINFSSSTAFLFNGILLPRYATFGLLYDLGNVQAIAGPQGTIYGGSAAGGALNVNAQRPEFDFSGRAQATVGDYNTYQFGIAQNLAQGDTFAVRGSFDYNRRDSYYNIDFDSPEVVQGRIQLRVRPSDAVDATFFLNHAKITGEPIITFQTNPFFFPGEPYRLRTVGPRGNTITPDLTFRDDRSTVIGANIEIRLGDNVFTYIPGYVDVTSEYKYYSGFNGGQLDILNNEKQHSQELRWSRRFGALQLSGGLFYLRDKIDSQYAILFVATPTTFRRTPLNDTLQTNTSYAAYAQAILSATERLRLTAGIRGSHDKIEASGFGFQVNRNVPFSFRESQTRPDYKLGVDFDVTDRILAYANFQTGYIQFGYDPDSTPANLVPTSELTAFSGGLKSRLFDNRVEFNIEVFHYDYKNYQAISFDSASGLSRVNQADARIYGVEVNARAALPFNTELRVGTVLQKPRFRDFVGAGFDFSGNRMANAADFTINAGATHTQDLGGDNKLIFAVDTRYDSGWFSNINNFASTKQERSMKTDASIRFKHGSGVWAIEAFVQNIEDKAVFKSIASGATPTLPSVGGLLPPRTFGARLLLNWE